MMQMILRYLLIAAATMIVIVVLVAGLRLSRLDGAYAQWEATDMVIDYMNDHDDHWPAIWMICGRILMPVAVAARSS